MGVKSPYAQRISGSIEASVVRLRPGKTGADSETGNGGQGAVSRERPSTPEGFNNKGKLTLRKSYGFRTYRAMENRIASFTWRSIRAQVHPLYTNIVGNTLTSLRTSLD